MSTQSYPTKVARLVEQYIFEKYKLKLSHQSTLRQRLMREESELAGEELRLRVENTLLQKLKTVVRELESGKAQISSWQQDTWSAGATKFTCSVLSEENGYFSATFRQFAK